MTATFLAALTWRGLANSVTLATTTHRKMGEMSNGTGTQVKVQMINKCKVLMTSRGLYKRRESEKKRNLEQKKERKTIAFNQGQRYIPYVSSDRISNGHEGDFLIFDCYMAQSELARTSLGPSSVTHSLQIHCIGLLGPKPHNCWAWAPNCDPTTSNIPTFILQYNTLK